MTPKDLEHLVDRYGRGWRLLAAQWSDEPDDCVQEALLRLIRLESPPDEPAAWVFRVVRNLATSQQRRRQTRLKHREKIGHARATWAASDPSLGLQLAEIQSALELLDDDRRTVVVSRIWGELTFESIGRCMGCSTATAHRMYQDALMQLGRRLEGITSAEQLSTCRPQPGSIP